LQLLDWSYRCFAAKIGKIIEAFLLMCFNL